MLLPSRLSIDFAAFFARIEENEEFLSMPAPGGLCAAKRDHSLLDVK
jgi:hypothetical protein